MKSYVAALNAFRSDLAQARVRWPRFTLEEKDTFLAQYVDDKLDEGESHQAMVCLAAALQKVSPADRLRVTWKILDAWRVERPVRQAPACPAEVCWALAVVLVFAGRAAEGKALHAGVLRCHAHW